MKRILAALLAIITVITCTPFFGAANNWNMEYFLKKYSDPHFDLTNEPDRPMTVEEFLGIVYAYSYYGDGNQNVTCKDKNGKAPSAWCAPFVQAEADKKVITPEDISWTEPVTLAFAAQYLARAKGKYSFDSNNLYSFTGTQGLSADDILYLSVAVDHGLLPYTAGMDVSKTIARRDARKYEVPSGAVTAKAPVPGSGNTMRETHAYFTDCYWNLDKAKLQYEMLQSSSPDITMVTFQCAYLNGAKASDGYEFFYCSMDHAEAVKYNGNYDHDPELDALQFCKDTGKLTFLGISNAADYAFTDAGVRRILSSEVNMDTAISEIVQESLKHGVSGVNMGIELNENYSDLRSCYGAFLKKLSAALHQKGLLLLVTTGAYFTESQENRSFYDYAAIDQAADYIHVILYDDFNDTGYPWRKTDGAISNLTRIGRCLRYAVTKMDHGKILLGTGDFSIDFDKTAVTAQDISYSETEALLQKTGASVTWDAASSGAYFDYADENGHNHRVWLETDGTMAARCVPVRQYDLCGFSTYYLASGAPRLLKAQAKTGSFYPEVSSAIGRALIPAQLRKNYAAAITRAEFCQMIAAFLQERTGMTLQQLMAAQNLTESTFTDCSETPVRAAGAMGIVTGYPDGTFKPQKTITRQEAATMLTRLAKFCGMENPNAESVKFTELDTMQAWAKEGVSFISACEDKTNGKRVMGGTGNGKFSPMGLYTREQSAMTMIRLLHALEG